MTTKGSYPNHWQAMVWPAVAGLVAAVSALLASQLGSVQFLPGACQRLDDYLHDNIIGQQLAMSQLITAVCAHLDLKDHQRPLILSVHGPPGVGKTYTHHLMARALYNKYPESVTQCPGVGCPGYKVIYGLDFPEATRHQELAAVQESIIQHVESVRDPLLVIEEYDKLDCHARTWLRNLLDHAAESGSSGALSRAVVLLESNLGFSELEEMLTRLGGDEDRLSAEAADSLLKDLLFKSWQSSARACPGDTFADLVRFTNVIDFFLPYFPLQRHHVQQVAHKLLQRLATRLQEDKAVQLTWDTHVTEWLTSKVDFDGPYPLEGAKQVGTIVTRYIAPAIRKCPSYKNVRGKRKKDPQELDQPHLMLQVVDNQLTAMYPSQPSKS